MTAPPNGSVTAPVAVRRVTVVAPSSRVDVSLPAMSTVAELVPALVRMAAGEKAGTGWRLGRLGAEAFDASMTVAGAGVRDGEILFLNPAAAADTRVVVDDIADTIAAAAAPALNWRPTLTRAGGLTAVVVGIGGAATAIGLAAPAWPTASTVNALLAVALLIVTAIVGRALKDGGAAIAVGGAGAIATVFAGLGLFAADDGLWLGAGPLVVACGGLVGYLVVAAVAAGAHAGWFLGAASAALAGCGGALVAAGGVRPAAVAAVLAAGALALTPALPMVALRLSNLALPRVPADPAGFQVEEPAVNRVEVAQKTRAAAQVLAALLATVATVTVGASSVLLFAEATKASRALAAAAGLALMLRCRAYRATGQRAALGVGGAIILALTVTSLARDGSWLLSGAAATGLGLAGLAYAVRAPRDEPSPYWGRFLEVVEFVTIVSLVPLAAAVLDLYQRARSLG